MMKDSKRNIRFNYLYRDEGNYKTFGNVIFSNPQNMELGKIVKLITDNLIDEQYFYPKKWALPNLSFEGTSDVEFETWNEFDVIELTEEPASDKRTIGEFTNALPANCLNN